MPASIKATIQLTVGCDPELTVIDEHRNFLNAYNYFKFQSSFGLDGNESIAELRPGYSESPVQLTAKIWKLLKIAHEKYPNIGFLAGHYQCGYPIGGHIHIGMSMKDDSIANDLTHQLDFTVGTFSDLTDDLNQRERRRKTGYGIPGAWRSQSHGLEYRTPGSWLLSPSIALANLTLAKIAALNFKVKQFDFKSLLLTKSSPKSFIQGLLEESNISVPEDCKFGLQQASLLVDKKIDWNQNILPNWGIS